MATELSFYGDENMVKIHGDGVDNAYCGSYPNIQMRNFKIIFDRTGENDNQKVVWHTEGLGNKDAWYHPTSGRYDYTLYVYIQVNDGDEKLILEKDVTSGSGWWASSALETHDIAETDFNTTSNTASVKILVKGKCSCMSGGNYCYRNTPYTCLYDFTAPLDPYEEFYNVSYNANGGSPTPSTQQKSNLSNLTLSTIAPTYPVTVTYYNEAGNSVQYVDSYNKTFGNWLCSADSNTYAPGATYSLNSTCIMTAQWTDPTATLRTISAGYFKVTYDYNGYSGDPKSVALARTIQGYSTTPGGPKVYNSGQANVTISTNLNLYPKYDSSVTWQYSTRPIPARQGYEFLGWYKDEALTQLIESDQTITADTTFYAKWLALPLHKYTSTGWSDVGPYVWIYNADGDNQWKQTAPLYKYDGTNWINISE